MYEVTLTMPIEQTDAENPKEAVEQFLAYLRHGDTRYVYTVVTPEGTEVQFDHDIEGQPE